MNDNSAAPPIPVLPVLDAASLKWQAKSAENSVLDIPNILMLDLGETAIHAALIHAGVAEGDQVLLPAFNCPSMVGPIRRLQAQAGYYEIEEDLSISLRAIEKHCTPRTRAVLVPHLFGRVRDLSLIREYCDHIGVVLIEDCAHSLFGSANGRPVGSMGHYAVASPRKILPLVEGGILASMDRKLSGIELRNPSPMRNVRVAFDMVDNACIHGRFKLISPFFRMLKALKRKSDSQSTMSSNDADSVSSHSLMRAAWPTRLTMGLWSRESALERRRQNYDILRKELHRASGMSVLDVMEGADDCVPYMLPVLLEDPEHVFHYVRRAGIPLWRWEESRMNVCSVTDKYARALVQIPCHQSLTSDELQRIVDVFDAVLRRRC